MDGVPHSKHLIERESGMITDNKIYCSVFQVIQPSGLISNTTLYKPWQHNISANIPLRAFFPFKQLFIKYLLMSVSKHKSGIFHTALPVFLSLKVIFFRSYFQFWTVDPVRSLWKDTTLSIYFQRQPINIIIFIIS